MLKQLNLILLFVVPFFGICQLVNYPPAPNSVYKPYEKNSLLFQEKSTLWSDDISNSANWSFSNSSNPTNDWSIETDPTAVSISGPLQTTTASNGFLVFKADTLQGATSDAYSEYAGATIVLTGAADVRIQFEQQFISDSNERIMEVSQDGITWFPFTISDGLSPTGAKMDDLASFNISSAVGNASSVLLRFHFSGSSKGYWAIDDISICSIDPFDLRGVNVDWGSTGAWGVRMPYYSVVSPQIQPVEFCLTAANEGLMDIDTAIYSVSIPVSTFSTADTFSIQADQQDEVCAISSFTPQSSGAYQIDYLLESTAMEQNLLNNNLPSEQFNVVDGLWIEYARDDLISGIQGGIVGSGLSEYEVGNIFDFVTDDYCLYIQTQIHTDAPVGAILEGLVYSYDGSGGFIPEAQTLTFTITPSDLGESVNLNILGGILFEANKSYLVAIRTYWFDTSNPSEVIIATSGTSKPNTSFLRYYDSSNNLESFYLAETPMVRLIFSPEGLDEEQSNFDFSISPNPSNESAQLSFDLPSSANAHVEIVDLSGKSIHKIEPVQFSEGSNQIELETAQLQNGVYFVKFTSELGSTAKRIVIQH